MSDISETSTVEDLKNEKKSVLSLLKKFVDSKPEKDKVYWEVVDHYLLLVSILNDAITLRSRMGEHNHAA